eukprot:4826080-Alexandrium_andersonii.AAC.1
MSAAPRYGGHSVEQSSPPPCTFACAGADVRKRAKNLPAVSLFGTQSAAAAIRGSPRCRTCVIASGTQKIDCAAPKWHQNPRLKLTTDTS